MSSKYISTTNQSHLLATISIKVSNFLNCFRSFVLSYTLKDNFIENLYIVFVL